MAIKTAEIFQSGMLLQRGLPAIVWGTGRPHEKICGAIQGKHAETIAGADGKWSLRLPPLRESSSEVLAIQGEDSALKFRDVAVGEVFVAAGQSNMEFWMRYEKHYAEMLPGCENPDIRFYDVPKLAYPEQENDFDYHNVGIWRKATPKDLEYFSAAGYYLARKLQADLSVPVGIIGCNWGGTRSLAWMREGHAREIQKEQTAAFESALGGRSYAEFYRACAGNPMNDTGNSVWNPFNDFILPATPSREEIAAFFAQDSGAGQPSEPALPKSAPGALFRHMVQRLAPYAVRAVLWYQGESDDEIDGVQKNYKAALDAIKADWRSEWGLPELPFLIVQLPGFSSWFGLENHAYPLIRECQQRAADGDKNAFLCSISDIGEEFDIHPKEKKRVGERLALLAEKHLFGWDILADAPRIRSAARDGDTVTLSFGHAEGGLVLDGDSINALKVFQGSRELDYTFTILGEKLLLQLPAGTSGSVCIRFAREGWYRVNLYNQAGIPAVPFECVCGTIKKTSFFQDCPL